jgi:ATP synthase protein I
VLKVALPRPSSDAVIRGDGRVHSNRPDRRVDDDADEKPPRRWSRAEVEALRQSEPVLSPWRVIAAQVVLGLVAGAVVWLLAGSAAAVSALYGAAVVALPGALMARGATSGSARSRH